MSAGEHITAPRCLHPMRYHDLGPGRPRQDRYPVCWRPQHPEGTRHISQYAYVRDLERTARRRKRARQELAA
jgi:hypothetical protein